MDFRSDSRLKNRRDFNYMLQEERSSREANPYIAAYLRGRQGSPVPSDQVEKENAPKLGGTFTLWSRRKEAGERPTLTLLPI